jgi:hypothetical protein
VAQEPTEAVIKRFAAERLADIGPETSPEELARLAYALGFVTRTAIYEIVHGSDPDAAIHSAAVAADMASEAYLGMIQRVVGFEPANDATDDRLMDEGHAIGVRYLEDKGYDMA